MLNPNRLNIFDETDDFSSPRGKRCPSCHMKIAEPIYDKGGGIVSCASCLWNRKTEEEKLRPEPTWMTPDWKKDLEEFCKTLVRKK